jgi:hypothetical protein
MRDGIWGWVVLIPLDVTIQAEQIDKDLSEKPQAEIHDILA